SKVSVDDGSAGCVHHRLAGDREKRIPIQIVHKKRVLPGEVEDAANDGGIATPSRETLDGAAAGKGQSSSIGSQQFFAGQSTSERRRTAPLEREAGVKHQIVGNGDMSRILNEVCAALERDWAAENAVAWGAGFEGHRAQNEGIPQVLERGRQRRCAENNIGGV